MSDERISFERKNLIVRTLLLVLIMGLSVLASLLYIISYPVTTIKIYNAETGEYIDEMEVRRNSTLAYIKTVEEPQGYTFQYYTFEDGTEFYPGMVMDKEVLNIYAVFTANYYTATYYVQYTNPETGLIEYRTDVAGCEPITYQYNSKFNLPTGKVAGNLLDIFTSVRGKTFVGWTTTLITNENEDTIKPLAPGSEQVILGNVNYYAVFAKNSYNVILHTGNEYQTNDGEELKVDNNNNPINYPIKDANGKYIIKNNRIHNEQDLVSIRYLDKLSDVTSKYADITLSEELDGEGAEEYDFKGWYLDEDYKYKASDYNIDVYVGDDKIPYLRYFVGDEEKSFPARVVGADEDNSPLYAFDLYSKWERRSYNIIFDKNTNKSSGRVEKIQVYKYDKKYGKYYNEGDENSLFGISTFTRLGQSQGKYYNNLYLNTEEITSKYFKESYKNYRFMGWATNSNPSVEGTEWYCRYVLKNETPNNDYQHLVSSDVTLYAQWSRIYTVTFAENANTYSARTYTKKGVTGEVIPLDGADYVTNALGWTKQYYKFAGWTSSLTSATPEVKVLENGGDEYSYTINNKNITLYVIWNYIPYKATFMANFSPDDNNKYSYTGYTDLRGGTQVKFPSSIPEREGYKFEGWSAYRYDVNEYATLRRSKKTVPDNQAIFTKASTFRVTGDMTYYACWTIDYTITYDPNFPPLANGESDDAKGIINSLNASVSYSSKGSNLTISIMGVGNKSSLTRGGYSFAGWTIKNSDGTLNKNFQFNQSATYVFDFYTYTDESDPSKNAIPCMYSKSNPSNKMPLYFENGTPTNEIKIVAMWTPTEYELTFRNTYNSQSKKITMLYTDVFYFDSAFTFDVTPSPAGKLPVAVANGRYFEGWAIEKDGSPEFGVGTTSNNQPLKDVIYGHQLGGNITFYTIFSIKEINVIFQIKTNENEEGSDEKRIDIYHTTPIFFGAKITLPNKPSGSRYDSANGSIYTFKNWYYIDDSGNKVIVKDGDPIRYYEEFADNEKGDDTARFVGKLVLWAEFEVIEYNIEFNFLLPDGQRVDLPAIETVLKDATYSTDMKSTYENMFKTIIPPTSVNTHTFAGFKNDYIDNPGYTIVLVEGMAFNTSNFPELRDSPKLTLTPIWNVNNVQIDYVYNNGSEDVIYDGGVLLFDSHDNYKLANSSIFETSDGHIISRWYITNGDSKIYFELEDYLIGVAYPSMSSFAEFIEWDSDKNEGNLRIYADVSESIVINYYSNTGLILQQNVEIVNGGASTTISSGSIAEIGDLVFAGWKVNSIDSNTTWMSNENVNLSTENYKSHVINLYADLSFDVEYKAIENYISPSSYDLNVVKRETINLFNDAKDGYITTYRIDSIIDNVNDNIEDGFELYGYEYDGNIVSKDDIANNNLLITVDGNNKEVILYIYKDVEITYTATKTSEEHLGDGSKTKTFVYRVGYDLKVLTPSGEILVENLIPVKPNYIHIGWKMTNNGVTGTTIYANNSRITLNNLSPVTMTAEYKQPDIGTTSIKVRFLPHSGSPDYIEEIYGNGETIRLKSLEELYAYDIAQGTNAKIWTNSRQIVVSWDLVDAVYGSTTFGMGDNYTVPITIDANAIIEFIANWENTYNIKFQAPVPNAENMPETIRVINGQMVYVKDISTPTPPASASNNEFKNWYYNNGVENVNLTNKDIIVVGFNATEYTISYRNDGYHIHTFPANMGNITDFIINSDWGRSKINITMRFYDEAINESTTSDEYGIYIDEKGRGFREYVNNDFYYGDGIADDIASLRSIIPGDIINNPTFESDTSAIAGWSLAYDNTVDSGILSTLTEDITVYAIWNTRYKVEYADAVVGNWEYSNDVRTTGYYFPGEIVTVDRNVIKTILKTGYITVYYDNGSYILTGDNNSKYFMLKGFSYDNGNSSFEIDETLSFTMIDNDVVLSPNLEEVYTVNFYENGVDSNACCFTEYRFAGKTIDLSQYRIERLDAEFEGWSETEGNNNSNIINSNIITINNHTRFYAVWNSQLLVTVKFNNEVSIFTISPNGQGKLDAGEFLYKLHSSNLLEEQNIGATENPVYIYTRNGNLYYLNNISYQGNYYNDIENLCSSATILSNYTTITLNFVNVYTINYYEDTSNSNKLHTDYVIDSNEATRGGLVLDSNRNNLYNVLNPDIDQFDVIEYQEPTSWKTRDGGYTVNFGVTIENITILLTHADSTHILNLYVNYINQKFNIYINYIPTGSNVLEYYLSGSELVHLTSDFAYEITGTPLLGADSQIQFITLEYGDDIGFSVLSPDHDYIKSKYFVHLSEYYEFVGWTTEYTKLGESVNFYQENSELNATTIKVDETFVLSADGDKNIYLYPVFKEIAIPVTIKTTAGVGEYSITNLSSVVINGTTYTQSQIQARVAMIEESSDSSILSKIVYISWYQQLTVAPKDANENYEFDNFILSQELANSLSDNNDNTVQNIGSAIIVLWNNQFVEKSNVISLIYVQIEINITVTLNYTNNLKNGADKSKITVGEKELTSSHTTDEITLNLTDIISIIYEVSEYYEVKSIVSGSKTLETSAISAISVATLDYDENNNATLIITLSPKTFDILFNLGGGEFTSNTLNISNEVYDGIPATYTLSESIKVPLGSNIVLPSAVKSIDGSEDTLELINWSTINGNVDAGSVYLVNKGITFSANYAGVKEIIYHINGEEIYTQLFSTNGVIVGDSNNADLQNAINDVVGGQYKVIRWKDRFSNTYYDNNSTISNASQSSYYLDAVLEGYDITINYTWSVNGSEKSYAVTYKFGNITLISEEELNNAGQETLESDSYIYGWSINNVTIESGEEVTNLFPTFHKDNANTFEISAVRYAKYSIELHYYYEEVRDGNQIVVGEGENSKALSEQFFLYADENNNVSSSQLKYNISNIKVSTLYPDYIDSYTVYLNSNIIQENLGIGETLNLQAPTTADYTYIYHLVASRASGIEIFKVKVTNPIDIEQFVDEFEINVSTVAVIGNNLPTFEIGDSVDTIYWFYKGLKVKDTTITDIDFNSYRLVGYKLSHSDGEVGNIITFDNKSYNVSGRSNYVLTTVWERLYKISYSDGERIVHTEYVSENASVITKDTFQAKASILVNDGYELVGFVETKGKEINNASSLESLITFGGEIRLNKDITLYPAWAKIYTINVDGNSLIEETFGSTFTTISYNENSPYYNTNKYTFTAYFSSDESTYKINLYRANVWFDSSDIRISFTQHYSIYKAFEDNLSPTNKFQIFDLTNNTTTETIYGIWSRNSYRVTFTNNALYNDGTAVDVSTSYKDVFIGETISEDDYFELKENTLDKYSFLNFYRITSDKENRSEFDLSTKIMMPMSIYLQYTGKYRVEYKDYNEYEYSGNNSALTSKTEVSVGTPKSSFYVDTRDFAIVNGLAIDYWTANGKDNFFTGDTTITLKELAYADKEYAIVLRPYIAGASYEVTLNYYASESDINNNYTSITATITHGSKIWNGSTSLFDSGTFKLADYITLGGYTCTSLISDKDGVVLLEEYSVDGVDTISLQYSETSYILTIHNGIAKYSNDQLLGVNKSDMFSIAYTKDNAGVTISGQIKAEVIVTKSSEIVIVEQAISGYKFDGWYIKVGGEWYRLDSQIPVAPPEISIGVNIGNKSFVTLKQFASDYEIYAVYTEKYYQLTVNISTPDREYTNAGFELKVGSANAINYIGAQSKTLTIQEGKAIAINSYQVKVGGVDKYNFVGFVGYNVNTLSIMMTGDLNITLQYEYSASASATVYFSVQKDGFKGSLASNTYSITSAQNNIFNYQTTIGAGNTLYCGADKYNVELNNYVFEGWLIRVGQTDYDMNRDYEVSPSETYYLIAKFSPKTITVNYMDTYNNKVIYSENILYNSTITLPYIVASYTNRQSEYVSYAWSYNEVEKAFGSTFKVANESNAPINSIAINAKFQIVYIASFTFDSDLFEVSGADTTGYELVEIPITVPNGNGYKRLELRDGSYVDKDGNGEDEFASISITLYSKTFEIPNFTITQTSTKVFDGWLLASNTYNANDEYTLNREHDYGADGTIEFTAKKADTVQFRFVIEGKQQAIYTVSDENSTPLEYVDMRVSEDVVAPYITIDREYVVGTYYGNLIINGVTYYIKPLDSNNNYIDLTKYVFHGWKASTTPITDTTVTDIVSYYGSVDNKNKCAFNYTISGVGNSLIDGGSMSDDLRVLINNGNYSYYTIWEKKKAVTFNLGENVYRVDYVNTHHLVENRAVGGSVTSVTYLLSYGESISYPTIVFTDKIFAGFKIAEPEGITDKFENGRFVLQYSASNSYVLDPLTGDGVNITFNLNFAQWARYFETVTQNSTKSKLLKMPQLTYMGEVFIPYNDDIGVDVSKIITTIPADVSNLLNKDNFMAEFNGVYPTGYSDIFYFAGWGSDTKSTTPEVGGWTAGQSVTLYAIWQRKTVTIDLQSKNSEMIEEGRTNTVQIPWGTRLTQIKYDESKYPTYPCDFTYLHDLEFTNGVRVYTEKLQNNCNNSDTRDITKAFLYWAYKGGVEPVFTNIQVFGDGYTENTISNYILNDINIYPYIVDKYEIKFINNDEQYGKSSYVLDSNLNQTIYDGYELPENTQILISDILSIFGSNYFANAYYLNRQSIAQTFTSNVTFNSNNFMVDSGNVVKVYVNLKFEATYIIPDYSEANVQSEENKIKYPLLKSAIDVGATNVSVGEFYSWKYAETGNESVTNSEFIFNISKVIKSATIELTLRNDKYDTYNLIIIYTDDEKEVVELSKVNLYFYAQIIKSYTLFVDENLSDIAHINDEVNMSSGTNSIDRSNNEGKFYFSETTKTSITINTHYVLSSKYMPIVKVNTIGYGAVTILHDGTANATINNYWSNREFSSDEVVDASITGKYNLDYLLSSTIDANLNITNSFRFYGNTDGDSYKLVLSAYTYTVRYQVTAESHADWQYATNYQGNISYSPFNSSATIDRQGTTDAIAIQDDFFVATNDYSIGIMKNPTFKYYFEYNPTTELYDIVILNVPYGMMLNVIYAKSNSDIYGWISDNGVQINGFQVTLQSTINTAIDDTIPTDIVLYMNMNLEYVVELMFEVKVEDVEGSYWENVLPSSKTTRTADDGNHYVIKWDYATIFEIPSETELIDGYNRYDITNFMNNITIEFNNTFNSSYSENDTGIKKMLNYFNYDNIWSSIESEGYHIKNGRHYGRFVNGKLTLRTVLNRAIISTIDTNTIDYLSGDVIGLDRGSILKDTLVVKNVENIVELYEYTENATDYVLDNKGNYKYRILSFNDNEVIVKTAYNYNLAIQAKADEAVNGQHVAYVIDSIAVENPIDQSIVISPANDTIMLEYGNANIWNGNCYRLFNKEKGLPMVNAHILVQATTFDINFTNIYMLDSGDPKDEIYTAKISYDEGAFSLGYDYYKVTLDSWYRNSNLGGNEFTTMPLFAGNHSSGKLFCHKYDKDIENKTYGYLYYIFNYWQDNGVKAGLDTVLQSSKTFSAVYFDGVYATESGPLDMVNFKIYDITYNEQVTTRILFNIDTKDMFGYNYSSNLDCIGIYDFFHDFSFTDTAFDSAFVGNQLMVRNYTFRQTYNQDHNDECVSDLENLQEENNIKYYDVYACLPYYVDREYFIGDSLDYIGSDSEKLLFWAFGGAYTISHNTNNNLNQLELSSACSYGIYYDGSQVEIRSGKLYANNTLISHIIYDGSKLIISPKVEGNKRTFAYFKVDVNGATWLTHINGGTAGNRDDIYDTTDTLISATSIVYSEHLNVMINFDEFDNLNKKSIATIEDKVDNNSKISNAWLPLHSDVFVAPDDFTTLTSRQYEIRMGEVTDNIQGQESENNTSTLIVGFKYRSAFTPVYVATTIATPLIQGYGSVSWNIYGCDSNKLYGSISQLGDTYLINDCNESLIIRLEYPPQKIDVVSNGAIYYFDYIRDDITEDWSVEFECSDDDRVKDLTDAYNTNYSYNSIPLDGSASQSILNITWKDGQMTIGKQIIATFPRDTEWDNLTSVAWQWTVDSTTDTNRTWTTIPAGVNANIIASTDIYVRLIAIWEMHDVSIVDKPASAYINNIPVENAYSMSDREYNNYVKVDGANNYTTLKVPAGYTNYTTDISQSGESITFSNSKHEEYTFEVSALLGAQSLHYGQGLFYNFSDITPTFYPVNIEFADTVGSSIRIFGWADKLATINVNVSMVEIEGVLNGYGEVKYNHFFLKDTTKSIPLGSNDFVSIRSEKSSEVLFKYDFATYDYKYVKFVTGLSSGISVQFREDEVAKHTYIMTRTSAETTQNAEYSKSYVSQMPSDHTITALFDATPTKSEKVFDIPLGGDYEYREFAVYGGDKLNYTKSSDAVTGQVQGYWTNWQYAPSGAITSWTFAISYTADEDNNNRYSKDLVVYPEWGTRIESIQYKQLPYVENHSQYTLSGGSEITSSGSDIITGGNSIAFWAETKIIKIKVFPYINAGMRRGQTLSEKNVIIVDPNGALIEYDTMSEENGKKYFVIELSESATYKLGFRSDILNSLGILFGQSTGTSFVDGVYKIKEMNNLQLSSVKLTSLNSENSTECLYERTSVYPSMSSLDIDSTKFDLDLMCTSRQNINVALKTTLTGGSISDLTTIGFGNVNQTVKGTVSLLQYNMASVSNVNKAVISVSKTSDVESTLSIVYYNGNVNISTVSYYVLMPSHYSFASDSFYGWKIATNEGRLDLSTGTSSHDGITYSEYTISDSKNWAIGEKVYKIEDLQAGITLYRDFTIILDIVRNPVYIYYESGSNDIYWRNFGSEDYPLDKVLHANKSAYIGKGVSSVVVPGGSISYYTATGAMISANYWSGKQVQHAGSYQLRTNNEINKGSNVNLSLSISANYKLAFVGENIQEYSNNSCPTGTDYQSTLLDNTTWAFVLIPQTPPDKILYYFKVDSEVYGGYDFNHGSASVSLLYNANKNTTMNSYVGKETEFGYFKGLTKSSSLYPYSRELISWKGVNNGWYVEYRDANDDLLHSFFTTDGTIDPSKDEYDNGLTNYTQVWFVLARPIEDVDYYFHMEQVVGNTANMMEYGPYAFNHPNANVKLNYSSTPISPWSGYLTKVEGRDYYAGIDSYIMGASQVYMYANDPNPFYLRRWKLEYKKDGVVIDDLTQYVSVTSINPADDTYDKGNSEYNEVHFTLIKDYLVTFATSYENMALIAKFNCYVPKYGDYILQDQEGKTLNDYASNVELTTMVCYDSSTGYKTRSDSVRRMVYANYMPNMTYRSVLMGIVSSRGDVFNYYWIERNNNNTTFTLMHDEDKMDDVGIEDYFTFTIPNVTQNITLTSQWMQLGYTITYTPRNDAYYDQNGRQSDMSTKKDYAGSTSTQFQGDIKVKYETLLLDMPYFVGEGLTYTGAFHPSSNFDTSGHYYGSTYAGANNGYFGFVDENGLGNAKASTTMTFYVGHNYTFKYKENGEQKSELRGKHSWQNNGNNNLWSFCMSNNHIGQCATGKTCKYCVMNNTDIENVEFEKFTAYRRFDGYQHKESTVCIECCILSKYNNQALDSVWYVIWDSEYHYELFSNAYTESQRSYKNMFADGDIVIVTSTYNNISSNGKFEHENMAESSCIMNCKGCGYTAVCEMVGIEDPGFHNIENISYEKCSGNCIVNSAGVHYHTDKSIYGYDKGYETEDGYIYAMYEHGIYEYDASLHWAYCYSGYVCADCGRMYHTHYCSDNESSMGYAYDFFDGEYYRDYYDRDSGSFDELIKSDYYSLYYDSGYADHQKSGFGRYLIKDYYTDPNNQYSQFYAQGGYSINGVHYGWCNMISVNDAQTCQEKNGSRCRYCYYSVDNSGTYGPHNYTIYEVTRPYNVYKDGGYCSYKMASANEVIRDYILVCSICGDDAFLEIDATYSYNGTLQYKTIKHVPFEDEFRYFYLAPSNNIEIYKNNQSIGIFVLNNETLKEKTKGAYCKYCGYEIYLTVDESNEIVWKSRVTATSGGLSRRVYLYHILDKSETWSGISNNRYLINFWYNYGAGLATTLYLRMSSTDILNYSNMFESSVTLSYNMKYISLSQIMGGDVTAFAKIVTQVDASYFRKKLF